MTSCQDILNVKYTVNSLPGGNNEASLSSLVVRYQRILGGGGTRSRTVSLNGRAAKGALNLTGLTTDTAYRVTYRVDIEVSFQVTLPSDIADPIELHTTSRVCPTPSSPGQLSTNSYCFMCNCLILQYFWSMFLCEIHFFIDCFVLPVLCVCVCVCVRVCVCESIWGTKLN